MLDTGNLRNKAMYQDAQFERKPSGAIIIDGQECAFTIPCVHGGEHFVSVRGSGARRGYCTRCGGITCGDPLHDVCLHWEKRIEMMESR